MKKEMKWWQVTDYFCYYDDVLSPSFPLCHLGILNRILNKDQYIIWFYISVTCKHEKGFMSSVSAYLYQSNWSEAMKLSTALDIQ